MMSRSMTITILGCFIASVWFWFCKSILNDFDLKSFATVWFWFWFEIIFYNMILISISNHFQNDFTQHWTSVLFDNTALDLGTLGVVSYHNVSNLLALFITLHVGLLIFNKNLAIANRSRVRTSIGLITLWPRNLRHSRSLEMGTIE